MTINGCLSDISVQLPPDFNQTVCQLQNKDVNYAGSKMSGKSGRRSRSYSKATSDAITKPYDRGGFDEISSADPVEYDIEQIILCGTNVKQFAKKLKEIKTKILRKRQKKKSKQLNECVNEFTTNYNKICIDIHALQRFLPPERQDPKPLYQDRHQCRECEKRQLYIWKLEKDVERLKKESNHRRGELITETEAKEDAIRSLKKEADRIRGELNAEKAAKEDAIRRLSELASSKLRDNNPNIADLSDQNRPTKLGEMTSELYDNEWTDAFDEFEKAGLNDEDVIYRLRCVFMDVYRECRQMNGDEWMTKLQMIIESNNMVPEGPTQTKPPGLPDLLKQQLKEFRKTRAKNIKDKIAEGFLRSGRLPYLNTPPYNQGNARVYVIKCIQLSWLMSIQDPPLHMSVSSNDEFNLNVFREYTKRGRFIAYVVWPVLYLHENGPILCKGVAQGTNDRSLAINAKPNSKDYNRNGIGVKRNGCPEPKTTAWKPANHKTEWTDDSRKNQRQTSQFRQTYHGDQGQGYIYASNPGNDFRYRHENASQDSYFLKNSTGTAV